jgi:hypothetical protein
LPQLRKASNSLRRSQQPEIVVATISQKKPTYKRLSRSSLMLAAKTPVSFSPVTF